MPWPGWAALSPLAGVIVSHESAAARADALARPLWGLDPPPEQAAASSPATAQVTRAALVESVRDGGFLSTGDLSVRGAAWLRGYVGRAAGRAVRLNPGPPD